MRFFLADSIFPWRSVRRCSLLLFALLLLVPLAASAQDTPSGFFPGAINIFAGTGSSSNTVTSGSSPTSVGIGIPNAVATDSKGDVFFATTAGEIYMVYAGGTVPPILAAVTTGASTPVTPVEGNIYLVAGSSSYCTSVSTTAAKAQFTTGTGGITSLWFDANDNLYIADSSCYDVSEIDNATATFKVIAGIAGSEGTTYSATTGNSQINGYSPTSLKLGTLFDTKTDSYGNIYITDTYNYVVYVIYAGTQAPPVLAAEGVTSPVQGDIYVIAGILKNRCTATDTSYCYQASAATSIPTDIPHSLFVDTAGNVYIADNNESVIRILYVGEVNGAVPPALVTAGYTNPTPGYIYVIAGLYSQSLITRCSSTGYGKPCGDGGLAISATLNAPYNVLVDSTGNVYFADYSDNAIRKIDTSGYISTIAGVDNPSGTKVAITAAGSGGAATSAALYHPVSLAFDSTQSNLYIADSNDVVWQVAAATAQTITFPELESSATYGDSVALGATASSGLDVSYTVSPTASGSVTGTGSSQKLNITAASGSVSVTAAQGTAAGGSTAVTSSSGAVTYYAPATPVTQTISTLNQAPLTVTANNVTLTPAQLATFDFSTTSAGFSATMTGWVNGDSSTTSGIYSGVPYFSTTATATASCGVDYPITPATGTLTSTNYDFANFVNGTLIVTGTTAQTLSLSSSLPSSVTYGKVTTVPLSATTSSGGTVTWSLLSGPGTVSGSTLTIGGAGTIKVQAIQNGTCTYAASPAVTYTLTVNPAPLTVTAPSATYPYGTNITTALAATSPTITGWVGTDSSSLVSGRAAYTTSATSTSDPGSFSLAVAQGTLSVASAEASNYTFANFFSGTITITKASQTIGYAAPSSITYGDYPTLTASANSNTTNASSGLTVTATVTGALALVSSSGTTFSLNATGVGAATVTLTQAGNTDYAAATVVLSFTVAQAPLYVTATSYTREEGAANPTFTYTIGTTTAGAVGGFQNGDTDIPSVVSGVPTLTTTATQASLPGTYTIAVDTSAMTSTNYYLKGINGTLTVTQPGTYAITANPSSLTITRGLSAQSTITITPSNEYQGTITLTCGTLPANVTCTISPSTYTFTGEYVENGYTYAEKAQTGTITINTTSATVVGSNARQKSNVSLAGLLIPGALAGIFLVFARKRVAKRSAIWSLCAVLALGIGATLGLSSCGGSSVSTIAAAGTTTITITGSGTTPSGSGTVTATVPLTVTIQ